jgi:hypothetical protein
MLVAFSIFTLCINSVCFNGDFRLLREKVRFSLSSIFEVRLYSNLSRRITVHYVVDLKSTYFAWFEPNVAGRYVDYTSETQASEHTTGG